MIFVVVVGSYSLQMQVSGSSCESRVAEVCTLIFQLCVQPQKLPSSKQNSSKSISLVFLQSLHQLGLTPILNMYLCGVESVWGEGASGGEVGEYQYEAAWRMTHWGDHTQRHAPFGPTGGRGGYHQSVYNCITALRDGEPTLVESCLSDARWVFKLCYTYR